MKNKMNQKETLWVVGAGLLVGIASVVLVVLGNPKNMGFCIACFLRDTAGALGMHQAGVVQYARPEIIGLVLGALIMALIGGEFKVRGGSSPMTRFVIGFFVMVGALMFLGCPLRMVLRIAGGDLNAVVGLVGFAAGILAGIFFLNKGFTLKKSNPQPVAEGLIMPAMNILVLVALVAVPAVLIFSAEGPGAQHAPLLVSLVAGLAVGAVAQKTRLCMVGGIRDSFLFRDFHLLLAFAAILAAAFVGNLLTGAFHPGFAGQPVAHTDALWNFLGMVLVGFGSVLLGGCPLRQVVLSGSGNSDSAAAVLGLVVGGAFCHNFGLASSAKGPTLNGQIAVVLGLALLAVIAVMNTKKAE